MIYCRLSEFISKVVELETNKADLFKIIGKKEKHANNYLELFKIVNYYSEFITNVVIKALMRNIEDDCI